MIIGERPERSQNVTRAIPLKTKLGCASEGMVSSMPVPLPARERACKGAATGGGW